MEFPILLFLDICRQCNRRQIQGFGVEYVVVFAKKNNNYVERNGNSEKGISIGTSILGEKSIKSQ
jgi:hypothetical protein